MRIEALNPNTFIQSCIHGPGTIPITLNKPEGNNYMSSERYKISKNSLQKVIILQYVEFLETQIKGDIFEIVF